MAREIRSRWGLKVICPDVLSTVWMLNSSELLAQIVFARPNATRPIYRFISQDGIFSSVQWRSFRALWDTNHMVIPLLHVRMTVRGVTHRRNVTVSWVLPITHEEMEGEISLIGVVTAIQCPPLAVDSRSMLVTVSSYKFGGIAQFQCAKGFAFWCYCYPTGSLWVLASVLDLPW